jgi:hypothetical protein
MMSTCLRVPRSHGLTVDRQRQQGCEECRV